MKLALGKKILTSIALIAIIAQSFSPYMAFSPKAYAEDATPAPTATIEQPAPTENPTSTVTETPPSDTIEAPTPTVTITPTPTGVPTPTDTVTPTPTDVPTNTVTPTPTQVDNLSPPTNNSSASLGQVQGIQSLQHQPQR